MEKTCWKKAFQSPPAENRAIPFWSWNGELNQDLMDQQIDVFRQMGYGGFHIHARVGLKDQYLGEKYMDCVRHCHEYAKEHGMQTWLYDEDKWPSGFGGGYVTKNPANRNRCLLLSRQRYPDGTHIQNRRQPSRLTENGRTTLLAAYNIQLDAQGYLMDYQRVDTTVANANWFAYQVLTDKLPWFNEQAYADLLNPDTTAALIHTTYEAYKAHVGDAFGKTIPAIFTDEPQHSMAHTLSNSLSNEDVVLPYTKGMDAAFEKTFGYGLLDRLPEVIWNDRKLVSRVRWQFHEYVTQRFADAYFAPLKKWCHENGLMLTGHVMREDKLSSQTECVGETMRLYEKMDLPGLDILADRHEYSTAKQVQSVCRQYDKAGMLCELYGVTNWDFGFKDHKLQADWLMALGTTVRVPHLAWMYMGGESKRDYPAALDIHAPWHSRYAELENYFARVCGVMSRGKAQVRVAVIHPIESFWAIYGPDDQTLAQRNKLEKNFEQIIEWLLFSQMDFDFVAESLLESQTIAMDQDGNLQIGAMTYEAVVLPPLITIRENTLRILTHFQKTGGKVICMGEYPGYVDAIPSLILKLENAIHIGFDRDALLRELEPQRDIRLLTGSNRPIEHLLYQLRTEDDNSWLFVAQGKEVKRADSRRSDPGDCVLKIGIRGNYIPELCDAQTGEIHPLPVSYQAGWIWVKIPFYAQDSVLLHLTKGMAAENVVVPERELGKPEYLIGNVEYELEEPNVLLLDIAQYRLNNGLWQPREEILRIDDSIRELLGYQKRTDAFPQPWLSGNQNICPDTVELRYYVNSLVDGIPVDLAYEPDCEIWWNGEKIPTATSSTYLDDAIRRIVLGTVIQGRNELRMRIPFGPKTNLEACYLLGTFGVRVVGDQALLETPPKALGFTDLCMQGFPFYGGNVCYSTQFTCQKHENVVVCVPCFSAAGIGVFIDGRWKGLIYKEPYKLDLGNYTPGEHILKFVSYGTRFNQLGQLHNCFSGNAYYDPFSWRTKDAEWSYSYQLRKSGILSTPFLQRELEN